MYLSCRLPSASIDLPITTLNQDQQSVALLLKYGELGHFASLEVSKKVPATYKDFDFFNQNNHNFESLKLFFFIYKKFLIFFADIR